MKIELHLKLKHGYYLEAFNIVETMKLLGNTESKITKDKNDQNLVYRLFNLVLVHCNLVNNEYQQDSRILYTFVPNKPIW